MHSSRRSFSCLFLPAQHSSFHSGRFFLQFLIAASGDTSFFVTTKARGLLSGPRTAPINQVGTGSRAGSCAMQPGAIKEPMWLKELEPIGNVPIVKVSRFMRVCVSVHACACLTSVDNSGCKERSHVAQGFGASWECACC